MQGCCQGFLFIAKLLSFYFVSTWSSDRWYLFVTTSIAWQLSHVLDGVVLLVFNPEFLRKFGKQTKVVKFDVTSFRQI
ncbi:hypothetical protein L596_014711 [Steinernema carpocapsae]|uniref:7TM GPCR serpentine receptor class x (Srx) domain-containing protein n=1 Tax=Steinernema carpocapsae TaxID=34508 RepID=A0A4V6A2W9_STECR|nr:hypothetical protein L596_014711 [Steinernema carpocapsae]